MKKLSVLIALVLLAIAGTGYAVTCAYDNVPAATLLVPYWKVTLNPAAGPGGVPGFPIPSGGTDTLVSIVNVSQPGVIAHVTVWNKYSKAVVDFNIPLTGADAVSFSMRDIMNGRLSPNYPQCDLNLPAAQLAACVDTKGVPPKSYPIDPCGLVNPGKPSATYKPSIGFAQTQFIRFSNPDATDVLTSISQYNLTAVDAIGVGFRTAVWNSLDESGDITTFTSSAGANILDKDNPACGWAASVPLSGSALSGYLTIDVVNYCTNFFPDQGDFYNKDAIATAGWTQTTAALNPGCPVPATACLLTYTPNVLIGDVFYVDSATQGGNVSGDPAVAIEFDTRLPFTATTKTFFGKFVALKTATQCLNETTTATGCTAYINAYAAAYQFPGDGREPLGDHYGFRYLADQANGLQSWITVWRSDLYAPYDATGVNLCAWADPTAKANNGDSGSGLYDTPHQVQIFTYDNDENLFGGVGVPPGPSGVPPGSQSPNYIFLESSRIDLLASSTANQGWNPSLFKGGWVDMTFVGAGLTGASARTGLYNMAWVGVQHTAPGAFISVGHAAANLNNQFQCSPNTTAVGTRSDRTANGGFPTFP